MATQTEGFSSDITVVGIGAMGGALARALSAKGDRVAVWNRSRDRAEALVDVGAQAPLQLEDAIRASPVVLTCLLDYAITLRLLEADGPRKALRGRTLVNSASASPATVRGFRDYAQSVGADYLDVKLMTYPIHIGAPNTVILVSGPRSVYERHAFTLDALGGRVTYLGEAIDAAATIYQAVWTYYYSALFGFMESAAYLRRSGVDIETFLTLAQSSTADLLWHIEDVTQRVRSGDFGGEQAQAATYTDGFAEMSAAFADVGLASEMLAAISTLTNRVADRHPTEDIAALVRLLSP